MPRVSYTDQNQEFELKSGDIIYDGLIDQGLDLPHGCLSGSCGACRIEIISGTENLEVASFIEKNTLQGLKDEFKLASDFPLRLACRTKIKGDVKFKTFKN